MNLNGKIALVTGAYRGIGLAIAHELAKAGAKVAACDVNAEYKTSMTKFFQEKDLTGQGFIMDVTDQNSIESALAEITSIYGMPQILINNAGITKDNLILRMSDEEWARVIDTNLNSVFRLSRLCIRSMVKERWGRIISIASVVGVIGNAGQANYAASKAGVIAFSKSLAKEVASRGITVNVVAPGFIDTAMTQKLSSEQREQLLALVPIKRYGQPDDIAKAVAFLVSDDASYITGETLHVNGGMFMA